MGIYTNSPELTVNQFGGKSTMKNQKSEHLQTPKYTVDQLVGNNWHTLAFLEINILQEEFTLIFLVISLHTYLSLLSLFLLIYLVSQNNSTINDVAY